MTTIEKTRVAPPAGWYKDPTGLPQFRFWNGRAWTNQVTAAQRPGAA